MKQNPFNEIAPEVKVCLGQIKIVSGDLLGNTKKITNAIDKAIEDGVDILVFPELAIPGYNCGMLFLQQHFIDYNLRFLHKVIAPKVPKNLVVVVGFVDCIGKKFDGTPNIQNSLAVIQDGYVVGKYAKILLANGGHHDDSHYFTPGTNANVTRVKIKGKEIGLGTVICEDAWQQDHDRNIVRESVQNGADVVVAINQSYFYYGKQFIRRNMCLKHSQSNGIYFINVNSIGVGDIGKNFMIYDGGSIITDPKGQIIAEANHFEEELKITPLKFSYERKQEGPKIRINEHPIFHPGGYSKYEEIFKALVFAQREIFKDLGLKKAQLHISGGIDSSVVLPILVEAMGVDNIIAISNPSEYNGDVTKGNAQYICDKLGVKLYWNEIGSVEKALELSHKKAFGKDSVKPIVLSTFDAVGRTVQGLAASHTFGTGIVATGNHTEIVLGWANFHDIASIGVMSIIGDLTKVEIFELAEYINKKYSDEIIPKNLYDGSTAPAAELADAKEDPFNYYVVSGICALLIRHMSDVVDVVGMYKNKTLPHDYFPFSPNGQSIYQIVNKDEFERQVRMCFERCRTSVFKTAQSAPIVLVSQVSRGFSSRETLINKYKGYYDDVEFLN